MYRLRLYLAVAVAVILTFSSHFAHADGVCTGYPKTYNGLPCASTTRYWDGNTGACGCGTGNSDPFSWQYTKPTAAASAPIFGSATWCGTGCGKCFRLTPTAIGASPLGSGATSTTPIVAKVTNLCPYSGNEEWCAYDVNSYGYDAHFDLMDYNMNGLVSSLGWNNPEVTYEEVDCASNGYTDWECQCASAMYDGNTTVPIVTPTTAPVTASPTTSPTKKPVNVVSTTTPTTSTTTTPTTSTTTSSNIKVQLATGINGWWVGLSVVSGSVTKVEIMSGTNTWNTMSFQGNNYWNLYSFSTSTQMVVPLSLRFTAADGSTVTANNIITSFVATTIDTGVAL